MSVRCVGSLPPPPLLAFTEADCDRHHAEWGCNCGPAALAAALGWSLGQVRPHLGDFETRRYMTTAMMINAVASSGFVARSVVPVGYPLHGVCRIQLGGPWIIDGRPARWAARHTHWVAVIRRDDLTWVFDVNSGWMPLDQWDRLTMTRIIDTTKRAEGWHLSNSLEIRRKAVARAD